MKSLPGPIFAAYVNSEQVSRFLTSECERERRPAVSFGTLQASSTVSALPPGTRNSRIGEL